MRITKVYEKNNLILIVTKPNLTFYVFMLNPVIYIWYVRNFCCVLYVHRR